jgi:hypothetical protein
MLALRPQGVSKRLIRAEAFVSTSPTQALVSAWTRMIDNHLRQAYENVKVSTYSEPSLAGNPKEAAAEGRLSCLSNHFS